MSNIDNANGVPIAYDSARLERQNIARIYIITQAKFYNTREKNEEQPLPILKEEVMNAIRTLQMENHQVLIMN